MEIAYQLDGRRLTIYLKGELDHHAMRGILERIDRWIEQSFPVRTTLDMGGLTFMDSSGIALVIRCKRRADLAGGEFCLANIPQHARKVLETAGLGRYIDLTSGG